MANGPLRVGVIGANPTYGWSPRTHLPALSAMPEFELTAVCTAHKETAEASAKAFGAKMAFHDYREMVKHPDIDAVAVVVKVPQHHELTMAALNAGKHVYTEWPLGANVAEAEEMTDLAKRQGVRTMVGLQGRRSAQLLRMKELVAEGYVGEVVSATMTQFASGALTRPSDRSWQADAAVGANTLTIAFGHAIDGMCNTLGEFAQVSSVVSTQVNQWTEADTGHTVDVTAPDNVTVSGRLKSGAVASAHMGMVPYLGSSHRTEVYGREGTLVLTNGAGTQLGNSQLFGAKADGDQLKEIEVSEPEWLAELGLKGSAMNVAKMWRDFGAAIANGTAVIPDFEAAVARHKLIAAIQQASATGAAQTL
jgi:predicted dehydrogenase